MYRIMGHPSKGLLDLDAARRAFLDRLSRYKRVGKIVITVVFDAYKGYSPNRQRVELQGIEMSIQGRTRLLMNLL
jgi:predicted RNA-binding protein with PIN domain